MTVSRRSLRKGLVAVGCVVGQPSDAATAAGLLLIVVSAGLHWLSKAYLEQNRQLTTAGPYRFSRNPFYLANLGIDVGILCVIGQAWVALVYLPLFTLAYRDTIQREEERLREVFGERFEAYAARVPRFLPLRAPLPASAARGGFDPSNPNLAEGREYARLLGIALCPAAILAAATLRRLGVSVLAREHAFELGLVLFVPALWILKLALAETFRRPSTRLLPSVGRGPSRLLASLVVSLPLVAALMVSGDDLQGAAAVLFATAAVASSTQAVDERWRVVAESAFAGAALALGVLARELWLSVLPVLWSGLAMLDAMGRIRSATRNGLPPASTWPYLPRVAAGGVVALLAIGFARYWVESGF